MSPFAALRNGDAAGGAGQLNEEVRRNVHAESLNRRAGRGDSAEKIMGRKC